jgi:hypothetical protein
MRVLAFEAVIVPYSPLTPAPAGRVSRTIAIRQDQTLEQLHEALRLAFGWYDPHLYSFWVGGDFWDPETPEYTAPYELETRLEGAESARIALLKLKLRKGSKLSYVFDFGDEWRLALTVVETWPADDGSYPMLVDAEGVTPPQYLELDDEDDA